MNPIFCYIFVVFPFIFNSCSSGKKAEIENIPTKEKNITLKDLNNKNVIGELGLPLGTIAVVRATIYDGDLLRRKRYSGSYLLKVTHVNDEIITSKPILEFSVLHARDIDLAPDNFELFFMINGYEAEELTSSQMESLKNEYVNKEVTLVCYETGEFAGLPEDTPDDVLPWQEHGFLFKTKLEILSRR